MSFLDWLFKDSEPVKQVKAVNTVADELRKYRESAEIKAKEEAEEWYSRMKPGLIEHCLTRCKEEAGKRFDSAYVSFNSSHRGYDFTNDIAYELRCLGLEVDIVSRGFLNVSWE